MSIDVLVVGAGPVGLCLATLLAKNGVKVRLVEKLGERCPYSRAFGVSARTVELVAVLGCDKQYQKRGGIASGIRHRFVNSELKWTMQPRVPGCEHSMTVLSQYEQEDILEAALKAEGVEIERGQEVIDVQQYRSAVDTTIRNTVTGVTQVIQSAYVAGCDGGHSKIRQLMEVPFNGTIDKGVMWMADAKCKNPMKLPSDDDEFAEMHHTKNGRLMRFKFGDEVDRIVCLMPDLTDPTPPSWEDFKVEVAKRALEPIEMESYTWLTAFHFNYRIAEHYRKDRLFIAGDAAHVHSPVGGQGMNMGVQDAFNLGWRLSGVINGIYPDKVLNEYEAERRPVAVSTIRVVRLATAGFYHHTWAHSLAMRLVSFGAYHSKLFRKYFTRAMLQLNLRYSTGSEDWQGSDYTDILSSDGKPGGRCPNVLVTTGEGEITTLHQICDKQKYTLFYFDGVAREAEDDDLWSLLQPLLDAKKLKSVRVSFSSAKRKDDALSTVDCLLARSLFVRSDSNAIYLVRPDHVVSYRARPVNKFKLLQVLGAI